MKKTTILIISIIILLIASGIAYWYLFFNGPGSNIDDPSINNEGGGFVPLNRPISENNQQNTNPSTETPDVSPSPAPLNKKIPSLRLLSNTPVGGYGASTTPDIASTTKIKGSKGTTVVRWIDRGRGNIYETRGDTSDVLTISNTVLPRVYESIWNKNLTSFIGTLFTEDAPLPNVILAQLKISGSSKTASSTTPANQNTLAPFELKGSNLPDKILAYAVSPKGDRIFMLINESGVSVGYIANFDGSSIKRIFDTPITQVNVEWPEDNTIAITTKGSVYREGFLYFVNTKTGIWRKILGPINGLSTKTSHDAKYVVYSSSNTVKKEVSTAIYNVTKNTESNTLFRTLADKCVWGNFYKEIVYCAVPSQLIPSLYPDDWYIGNISFSDKIWQISANTEEVHLISTIIDQSDRIIDAFNLDLDLKDDFLFFMNKNDLSLWSFDLVSSN